jgi:PHD/YefM family antitoxin component YafN of YafNO toxin-antitoxin module
MENRNIKTIEINEPSVVISLKEYEGLKETLEILSDNDLVKEISEALLEKKEDRVNHKDLFGGI